MFMLFIAFAASVILVGLLALTIDTWQPWPRRPAEDADHSLAVVLFSLGVLHVALSAVIRMFAPTRLPKRPDPQSVANLARAVQVLTLALCEAPALFGLVYVILGGDIRPTAFLFSFALTCMAAHHVMRLRP